MGTKLHCESYLTGYYSMRNPNEDSSFTSWPLFYGDKSLTNGQCYNGFTPRIMKDVYSGYDKNALRQRILEHETIFKNQVNELHRLYGIQRDMMEEIKMKELQKHWASVEPSSSSSRQVSQMPLDDAKKWHKMGFPLLNSGYDRTSMSGVEIVNSPSSCSKGYNMQAGHSPLQNGCTSKDSEVLNLRPSKVRKKLFDLQLPADEYIDTEEGEKLQDNKKSGILSYTLNGDQKSIPERGMEFYLGASGSGKTRCQKDALGSGSCLRSSSGLADLNEPVHVDEATAPSSADLFGHTSNHGETILINQSAKTNAGFPLLNIFGESKINERGLLSHINEAGPSKGNPNLISQNLKQDKVPILSHPSEVLLNRAHHPPGINPTGHSGEDIWRNELIHGLKSSDRNQYHSNYGHLEPVVASRIPGPHPFVRSSSFANSLSESVSSWAKPTSSLGQKITMSSRSMQPSVQSREAFGDKWNVSSRLNPGSGSDITIRNGFYHGPALGSKEPVHLPSSDSNFLKCSRGVNLASERSINPGFEKFLKGTNHLSLNGVMTNSLPNKAVPLKDLSMVDRNSAPKDHPLSFPWLGHKPGYENEAAKSRKSELSEIFGSLQASFNSGLRDLNQVFTSNVSLASNDCEIGANGEMGETKKNQKILGFPIFEIPNAPKNESSSLVSEGRNVENEKKNILIDINLACESEEHIAAEELIVENKLHSKGISIRSQIDLNTCISEDEDPSAPSVASNSASVKIVLEIDLEAPVLPEMEDDIIPGKEDEQNQASLQCNEDKAEQVQDEVLRNAAKTIFAISSSCQQIQSEDLICDPSETSLTESILWFANVVSSCANELKGKCDAPIQDLSKEMDDFEAMALQLTETKEQDYMPKPFVPEVAKGEEMGTTSFPSRSRRGQARRGRQRRDFQRDILPSLASLSRHEVTEDIQIFGALMRASGHSWNSGLTRRNGTRNGGARERRCKLVDTPSAPVESPVCTALVQKLNNANAGLEDISLTGWGKTTRRPRRQRCPAGNPPIVPLT
ncbi:Hypothetical predicted protein [Olea europaea subsp. europaea]|uniref:Uncharacterized protein n=1 Tax=Olea europaea subsp. europaea TaxID=158383 RepID=A0A8S0SDP6_OLEEU|nr:Hypothetical predicted protein [Olea europaea subsp. europaea]